jgi:hypothetical protein
MLCRPRLLARAIAIANPKSFIAADETRMDTDKDGTRSTRDFAGNSKGSNRETMAPPVFRERGPIPSPSHFSDLSLSVASFP